MDPQLARRTDKKGQTSLHMAMKGVCCEVVRLLLEADAAIVMLPDKFCNTALHAATRKNRLEVLHCVATCIHLTSLLHWEILERINVFSWFTIELCAFICTGICHKSIYYQFHSFSIWIIIADFTKGCIRFSNCFLHLLLSLTTMINKKFLNGKIIVFFFYYWYFSCNWIYIEHNNICSLISLITHKIWMVL